MSPYEPLQPDIIQSSFAIADTRTIALIAAQEKFQPR